MITIISKKKRVTTENYSPSNTPNSYKMDEVCQEFINVIENTEMLNKLIEKAQNCILAAIPNLSNTEANKTLSTINEMLLYASINWTSKDISQATYFTQYIDNYLISFKNMRIYGDLRYNFTKNYEYLTTFISSNQLISSLFDQNNLSAVLQNYDEASKDDRKRGSTLIVKEIEQLKATISNNIKKATEFKYKHSND